MKYNIQSNELYLPCLYSSVDCFYDSKWEFRSVNCAVLEFLIDWYLYCWSVALREKSDWQAADVTTWSYKQSACRYLDYTC